jgi:hypothetical protein
MDEPSDVKISKDGVVKKYGRKKVALKKLVFPTSSGLIHNSPTEEEGMTARIHWKKNMFVIDLYLVDIFAQFIHILNTCSTFCSPSSLKHKFSHFYRLSSL